MSEDWQQLLRSTGVAFSETGVGAASEEDGDSFIVAGDSRSEQEETAAVDSAFRSQWREARRFELNASLRREKENIVRKLKEFSVHLSTRSSRGAAAEGNKGQKRVKQ